jgi:hypothetical protein
MRFATGWRPSAPHKKALFGALHPSAPAPAYPAAAALRPYKPPTFDQGATSSCTGHATVALIFVAMAVALSGGRPSWIGSPWDAYANARCEEQPGDGPLDDVGAAIADMMLAIARVGVRAIGALADDGRFSDVTPANVTRRPTLADDVAAAKHPILGPEHLDPEAPDFLDQVAASIGAFRCGVSAGIHANRAFQYWKAGDAPVDDATGFSDEDGHNVAVLDYRTEADGSLSFWLLSSWSDDFGEDGGAWVTGAWLQRSCMEAWRFRVRAAA